MDTKKNNKKRTKFINDINAKVRYKKWNILEIIKTNKRNIKKILTQVKKKLKKAENWEKYIYTKKIKKKIKVKTKANNNLYEKFTNNFINKYIKGKTKSGKIIKILNKELNKYKISRDSSNSEIIDKYVISYFSNLFSTKLSNYNSDKEKK